MDDGAALGILGGLLGALGGTTFRLGLAIGDSMVLFDIYCVYVIAWTCSCI
jgi:hypothetical protein